MAISDQQVPMVRMISLAETHADQNVRERLVVEEVDQLAQSIALLGQLSPVSVRADRSSWRTWPKVNARRNVPSVDGAATA